MPKAAKLPSTRLAILAATSGHSGVDCILTNLIEQWSAWGLEIDLLQIRRHGPHLAQVPAGVRCIDLGSSHVNTALPALLGYLRRTRPAALLTDKDRVNRLAILARALASPQTRLVVRLGTHVSVNLASRKRLERWAQTASIRWLYPFADRVLVPSAGVAEDLRAHFALSPALISIAPSPIVSPRLRDLARETIDHPWFNPSPVDGDRPPVILGMGELGARKDFATLIRAFARVNAERPCRLVILGRGRQHAALLKLAEELGVRARVDLPGFVANPYPFMQRADLFALTSRWEGLGIVLVEALACGTPAVSTDCPSGPREILGPCCPDQLVPVGDDRALAEVIGRTLADPPQPARLIERANAFSVAESAAVYLEALGITADSVRPGGPVRRESL
ncbi:N-acetylgalactosamine-N,N'-diacetylbacillosaminyl-diphospho-undecaprenol 4-alpha-N-acetylgalactosaminyltransferase [Thiorhodovibrio winogradskyi]|uniref:N-acetylgalactosamine-N, N'-diacetylbacillosaminyl-diphospho-undecaprenol 4-alpha-N-acetylgalactosaminyltransferase n=1 Tax=Thiorhodovibrio winogradskyi TaxID=77007 RepID=A0ABZ0SF06_9GAMM|nr:glycosyltransferase [Thiorhodovibrio winogradskyi]